MPSSSKSSGQLGAEARGRAGNGGLGQSASVTGNRFGAPSASTQAAAARRNAPTNGMFGGGGTQQQNMRRSVNPTPSYDPSLHNFMEMGKFAMPGPGLVTGAARMVAGYGPDFQGYRGQVNGPGDYDPKDRPAGINMQGAPAGYQGALMAQHRPAQPMLFNPAVRLPNQQAPGQYLSGGLPGYGTFRPGYNFIGPGGPFR